MSSSSSRPANDVEGVRVDVLVQVLAHDERVAERAEIRLQIGDRLTRRGVGQIELQMTVEPGDEGRGVVADRRGEVVDRLREFVIRCEPRSVTGEIASHSRRSRSGAR